MYGYRTLVSNALLRHRQCFCPSRLALLHLRRLWFRLLLLWNLPPSTPFVTLQLWSELRGIAHSCCNKCWVPQPQILSERFCHFKSVLIPVQRAKRPRHKNGNCLIFNACARPYISRHSTVNNIADFTWVFSLNQWSLSLSLFFTGSY